MKNDSVSFDDFISLYKKLECLCRDRNLEIKVYESQLNEADMNRLRMCRYFRNFIQHNEDYESYLFITKEMYDFLKEIYNKLLLSGDVIKKHMVKIDKYSCTVKDNVAKVMEKFQKTKSPILFVFDDKKFLGAISVLDLLSSKKKTDKIGLFKKKIFRNNGYIRVKESDRFTVLPKDKLALVENEYGNIVGAIKKDF